jgi:hypothetical protein
MSIALTVAQTYDGPRRAVIQASAMTVDDSAPDNLTLETLVDVSTMTPPAESVRVTGIRGQVGYGVVELYWSALPPVRFAVLSGDAIAYDYLDTGPLRPPADSNGDILISTVGFAPASTFMFELGLLKRVL